MPQSEFRANMGDCMKLVNLEGEHLVLTRHRKPRAVVIPFRHARALWHLQRRDLNVIEQRIEKAYPAWVEAKELTGSKRGMTLDGPGYLIWGGLEGL